MLRRQVVQENLEHPLVRFRDRVLNLAEMEADEVVEARVDGENPGEVVVQVDLGI